MGWGMCKGICDNSTGPCGRKIAIGRTEYTFLGWNQCRACDGYLEFYNTKPGGNFCLCCGCHMSMWPRHPRTRRVCKRLKEKYPERIYRNRLEIYAAARSENIIAVRS